MADILNVNNEESPLRGELGNSLEFDLSHIATRQKLCDPKEVRIIRFYFISCWFLGLRGFYDIDLRRETGSWFSKRALFQTIRVFLLTIIPLIFLLVVGFLSPGYFNQVQLPSFLESHWFGNVPYCLPLYAKYGSFFRDQKAFDNFLGYTTVVVYIFFAIFACYLPMMHFLHAPYLERAFSMAQKARAIRGSVLSFLSAILCGIVAFSGSLVVSVFFYSNDFQWYDAILLPFVWLFSGFVAFSAAFAISTLVWSFYFLQVAMAGYRDDTLKKWNGQPVEEYLVQKHYSIFYMMQQSAERWTYPLTGSLILSILLTIWSVFAFLISGRFWILSGSGTILGYVFLLSLMANTSSVNLSVHRLAADTRGKLAFQTNRKLISQWEKFLLYLSHLNPYWSFWVGISTSLLSSVLFGALAISGIIAPIVFHYLSPCLQLNSGE